MSTLLVFDLAESSFFQPGNLRLRNADFLCNLHLRFALHEAQVEDFFLPGVQIADGLTQENFIYPAVVAVLIADLIHDVNGVAAIRIDRFIERNRLHN